MVKGIVGLMEVALGKKGQVVCPFRHVRQFLMALTTLQQFLIVLHNLFAV